MEKKEVIQRTVEFVRQKLSGEGSGHDWWHVYRVWKTSQHIAKIEKADMFVVELAALLHDIADWKFHGNDLKAGSIISREWLESQGVDETTIRQVLHIVEHSSYKGAGEKNSIESLEGKLVQDADRLDAIGAIGIARTFAYGGHKNREIYNPEVKPQLHNTFEEYKNSKGTTINHFYEKLLLLKDRMNTETAKKIAEQRHTYMENFLQEFYAECEGKR